MVCGIIHIIMVAIGTTVDRMTVDLTTTHGALTTRANSVARAAAGSSQQRRTNRRNCTHPTKPKINGGAKKAKRSTAEDGTTPTRRKTRAAPSTARSVSNVVVLYTRVLTMMSPIVGTPTCVGTSTSTNPTWGGPSP